MLAVSVVVVFLIALYFIFKAVDSKSRTEASEVPPVINQETFSAIVEEAPVEEPKAKKLKAEKKPTKAAEKVKKEPKKVVKKAKQ